MMYSGCALLSPKTRMIACLISVWKTIMCSRWGVRTVSQVTSRRVIRRSKVSCQKVRLQVRATVIAAPAVSTTASSGRTVWRSLRLMRPRSVLGTSAAAQAAGGRAARPPPPHRQEPEQPEDRAGDRDDADPAAGHHRGAFLGADDDGPRPLSRGREPDDHLAFFAATDRLGSGDVDEVAAGGDVGLDRARRPWRVFDPVAVADAFLDRHVQRFRQGGLHDRPLAVAELQGRVPGRRRL